MEKVSDGLGQGLGFRGVTVRCTLASGRAGCVATAVGRYTFRRKSPSSPALENA